MNVIDGKESILSASAPQERQEQPAAGFSMPKTWIGFRSGIPVPGAAICARPPRR